MAARQRGLPGAPPSGPPRRLRRRVGGTQPAPAPRRGPPTRRPRRHSFGSRTAARRAIRGSSSSAGAVVGGAFVLAAAALTKPSDPPRPDNVLEPGSCVVIEANGDAREVTCAGTADDLVVDRVVPLDGRAPSGLSAYRDRQGMGYRLRRRAAARTQRRSPLLTCEVPEGRVAQLVRAPRSHRGGHGFESRRAHRESTW